MGERERRRRYPSLLWPLLLIAIGALLLLNSLGYIDLSFWEMWRYWPVLLILIGLDLLLGRRSRLGSLIVALLTLAVIGGGVWLVVQAPGQLGGGGEVDRIAEPLEGAERASLDVRSAAGKLTMSQLEDSSLLVEATLDLATSRKPTWQVERNGDQVSMQLAYESGRSFNIGWGRGETWDLRLSPAVAWELTANLAAGEARLDLTGLDLDALSLELGAGQYVVTLPETMGGKATIKGGVGSLVLEIPEGLAARVSIERGIAPASMSDRFEKKDGAYVTRDWETSANRVEVEINLGVGGITVREP
ncbi:MAG: hypothetical protein JXM73_04220 [Anaerolineae bacterium]|nr:hypothetical protein [Anaerolineae bacterium]